MEVAVGWISLPLSPTAQGGLDPHPDRGRPAQWLVGPRHTAPYKRGWRPGRLTTQGSSLPPLHPTNPNPIKGAQPVTGNATAAPRPRRDRVQPPLPRPPSPSRPPSPPSTSSPRRQRRCSAHLHPSTPQPNGLSKPSPSSIVVQTSTQIEPPD